jgi:hypothetical protein
VCSNADGEDENVGIKKMHQYYLQNRMSEDHSVMAKCYVVKEFLRTMVRLPEGMKAAYSDNATVALENRLRVLLVAFQLIYVDGRLLSDHSFNSITNAVHYKKFFDQFVNANPPLLQEFVTAYRLDE